MDFQDDEPKKGTPLWYLTFSDLMALLVGFFVLLFSFSSLESGRFRQAAGSMRAAFSSAEAPVVVSEKATIFDQAVRLLDSQRLGGLVTADLDEEGVRLRIDGALLFESGSAVLQPEALPLLDRVAQLASQSGKTVIVEGHTDSLPIHSPVYPSNWELAGARAGAVVRHLRSRGLPAAGLEAVAYADSRPRATNQTEEGRRKNRRVEILLRTEG
jgi:chemotaxis protein MotB